MPVRSVELAREQLGGYFGDYVEATDVGTRHFWISFAGDAHRLTTCCRANILRCLIADELKQRLDGRPNINIIEAQQTTTFLFGQDWVLKIHKCDEEGHTAPNDTQACLDLNDNDTHSLPGLPPMATVVFLGYLELVADRFNPEIRLICPDGSAPAWIIDLRDTSSAPPTPIEITGGNDSGGGTLVVVKRQGRKASH